jgi:alkylation response protein AidB-like acyl-CoA dehydrogenase
VNLSVQEKDGGPAADPSLADTLARHLCEAHAAGLSYQRMVAEIASRGEVGVEASVGKLFTTELGKRVATTAMTALPYANIDSPVMPWRGGCISWPLEFINGFKNTIAAGTSQIQRNIIGERVLQLPRQRGTRQ